MLEIEQIFKYKKPNIKKLAACGFVQSGDAYSLEKPIMHGQFTLLIEINADGGVDYKVLDTALNEEYVLVRVSGAQGGFVGEVREACDAALRDIADTCFDTETFKAEQTQRVLDYIKSAFNAQPEYLWEGTPNNAAIRRSDNQKWFAAVLTADGAKFGLDGQGDAEIIDLKDAPENVAARVDGKAYFPGYHMNKKHWYTVCLNGSVPDETLFKLIDTSYAAAATGRKTL